MPTTRRMSSPPADVTDAVKAFLVRRTAELVGLGLIAAMVTVAIALATWSVDDPSLNHATRGAVRNWVGPPGAIVADVLMQILGLGAIVLVAVPGLWGVLLMRQREVGRLGLRLACWIVAAGCAAALASLLPATGRWPLPTGLGGVGGDSLVAVTRAVVGMFGAVGLAAAGLAFAAAAILSFAAACSADEIETLDDDHHEDERARRDDPEEDRTDEPGLGLLSLGAVTHLALATGAASLRLGRAIGRRVGAMAGVETVAGTGRRSLREADGPAPAPAGYSRRREPVFEGDAGQAGWRPLRPPEPATDYDDDEPPFDPAPTEAPYEDARQDARHDGGRYAPAPEREAPGRVAPPPASPKPGRRLARESQPTLFEADAYRLPALTLLGEPKRAVTVVSQESLDQNATLLEGVLDDFGVRGDIINVRPGPVVTLYELEPAPGTKSSRVISLADDIARSMSAVSARVAVVPGRNAIGIELPNARRETVYLRELLASQDFETAKAKLALCLGKTIGGEPVIADLARMPHLLVAGTTGSGKSVAINTMILSILYRLRPEECRLIMIDPKMLELSVYDGIPHLLTPVVTDPKKAVVALKWAVREMEDRYKKMSKVGVRNIDGFNARVQEAKAKGEVIVRTVQTGYDRDTGEAIYEEEVMDLEPLPYLVVIVDEMADLMMVAGKEIEGAIQRLAQMARAAGIHVVLATQRPSVDVITGTIKANFPTRISFQVTSKIDSRTILGEMGAEQLLGQGDMLYMAGGGRITRVHGPFVSDEEVEKVVAHLKMQGRPQYLDAVTAGEDEPESAEDGAVFDQGSFGSPGGDLYDQAVAVVLRDKKASTSYIQRRLQIGYNRAASLMERMENEGIVGPANHAGKREILLEDQGRRHDDDD